MKVLVHKTLLCFITSLVLCYDVLAESSDAIFAEFQTSKGNVIAELYYEQLPLTVTQFVGLAQGNLNIKNEKQPFYKNSTIDSVVPNFMLKVNTPDLGDKSKAKYVFSEQTSLLKKVSHDAEGTLTMAMNDHGQATAEIGITFKAWPFLNDSRIPFGKVIEGMDVLRSLQVEDKLINIQIKTIGDYKLSEILSPKRIRALKRKTRNSNSNAIRKKNVEEYKLIQAKWPNHKSFTRGVFYLIDKEGQSTKKPKAGDAVYIHYKAMLLDGTVFDEYKDKKIGYRFTIDKGHVIRGLNLMVKDMGLGEKRTAIFKPEYAFGKIGFGKDVKSDQTVVYEIELINVISKNRK